MCSTNAHIAPWGERHIIHRPLSHERVREWTGRNFDLRFFFDLRNFSLVHGEFGNHGSMDFKLALNGRDDGNPLSVRM